MSQNARPNKGTFSPYAVDSFEDIGQRAPSSIKGSYQNQAYSSIEDDQLTHQYEDPAHLAGRILTPSSTGPRRKRNRLYEPTEFHGHEQGESDNDFNGESWLSRLILFLILVVSLTALLLVVLIILGKLGPSCSCNSDQAEAPRGEQLVSSDEPDNKNDLPPDVQSLNDKINQLRGNISLIKAALNVLQTDVIATKGDIHATNRMINGTTTRLSALKVKTQLSVAQTRSNISKQIDEALSATNDSFQSKLASLTAVFMTKLNDTEQNLLNADVSLQSSLNTINSSLSAQVQSISKLQGLTGPPGFNGSSGMKGAKGADGPQGYTGSQGDQGPKGASGEDGTDGGDGPTGPDGAKGAKGQKGDKGNPGVNGTQGLQGPQGPQGAGNFSQCSYKVEDTMGSPGPGALVEVDIIETQDKKFLGVTCSTNNAEEYNLASILLPNGRLYKCTCKGESKLFFDSVDSTVCYIHYWECPLTT